MQDLKNSILSRNGVNGISISQVIERALFDKDNGYYLTKNPLGKDGDFTTASEISQIFGEIIASYFLHIFSSQQPKISLVEIGAGRGFLFYDILKSINNLAKKNHSLALDFIEQATFHIIEINPVLIKSQQENLNEFSSIFKINWHKKFSDFLLAKQGEIYLFSNELFDCFAIDQFVKTKMGWCQRVVRFEDNKNLKKPQLIIDEFNIKIDEFIRQELGNKFSFQAKIGAVFEYSLSARNFMNELAQAIKQNGGIALNCDYGYYDYDFANTLQAVKNHQKIDFIEGLSGCDITAHVDFFALDKIAKNFNLNSSLVSQRQFLLQLGVIERKQMLIAQNPTQEQEISFALERLISPKEMGELFKFHIIWR